MHNILVADTPEAGALLHALLQGKFEVSHATNMAELRRDLEAQPPDLVICGCHFDEGRMYDALRYLRLSSPSIPFVAIRALSGELDDAVYEAVKIATRALDGNAFVDLFRWRRKYGEAEAAARLVQLVRQLLDSAEAAGQ